MPYMDFFLYNACFYVYVRAVDDCSRKEHKF